MLKTHLPLWFSDLGIWSRPQRNVRLTSQVEHYFEGMSTVSCSISLKPLRLSQVSLSERGEEERRWQGGQSDLPSTRSRTAFWSSRWIIYSPGVWIITIKNNATTRLSIIKIIYSFGYKMWLKLQPWIEKLVILDSLYFDADLTFLLLKTCCCMIVQPWWRSWRAFHFNKFHYITFPGVDLFDSVQLLVTWTATAECFIQSGIALQRRSKCKQIDNFGGWKSDKKAPVAPNKSAFSLLSDLFF